MQYRNSRGESLLYALLLRLLPLKNAGVCRFMFLIEVVYINYSYVSPLCKLSRRRKLLNIE